MVEHINPEFITIADPEDEEEYEIEPPETPKHLLCRNCKDIPLHASYCSECSEILCRKCTESNTTCPLCETTPYTPLPLPKFMAEELHSLLFICPNRYYGCMVELMYGEIGDHIPNCEFKKSALFETESPVKKGNKKEEYSKEEAMKGLMESKGVLHGVVVEKENVEKIYSRVRERFLSRWNGWRE